MNDEPNNPAGNDDALHAGNQTEHDQRDAGGHEAGHGDQRSADADGMKTAELLLPYMEPVEDFRHCLNDNPSNLDALTALANDMDWAAEILRAVKDAIAGHEARVWTEPDLILVRGPAAVIDDLIGKGHLEIWPRTEEVEDAQHDDNPAPTAEHDQHAARTDDAGPHAADGDHDDGLKTADLDLPYFQRGDDLRRYLEKTGNLSKALAVHASLMDEAARMLRHFKHALAGREVTVEARAALILVSGTAELIDDLLEKGALEESVWLDEAKRRLAAEKEQMARIPQLIRCGDHKMAPWVVVCIHILDRTATAVVPVLSERGGEVEYDWFCTKCYEEFCGDEASPNPDKTASSWSASTASGRFRSHTERRESFEPRLTYATDPDTRGDSLLPERPMSSRNPL